MSALIPLTKGQFAIVDDEDYAFLMQWKWAAHWSKITKSYYADRTDCSAGRRHPKHIGMHRLLAKTPKGLRTDHRDHNTLNNQKYNLRICTPKQNGQNRKRRYDSLTGKGVNAKTLASGSPRYRARIWVNNRNIHLGYFDTSEKADKAYQEASLQHFGEFSLYSLSAHPPCSPPSDQA